MEKEARRVAVDADVVLRNLTGASSSSCMVLVGISGLTHASMRAIQMSLAIFDGS